MFLTVIIIPIYILALVAMFFMDTFYKASMFLLMLFIATFVLFLFINYPLPAAGAVIAIIALFAFRFKG